MNGLHPTFAAILSDAAAANVATSNAVAAAAGQFDPLTDAQLLAEADRLARRVSFFAAAEGNWSDETDARNAANACFRACSDEVARRGLTFDRGEYLL